MGSARLREAAAPGPGDHLIICQGEQSRAAEVVVAVGARVVAEAKPIAERNGSAGLTERAAADRNAAGQADAARKRQGTRAGLRQVAAAIDGLENVTLSLWLKTRLPLSSTLLVPPIEAPLPPLPICSAPAPTVVTPL